MPSTLHETLVDLFRQRPSLAVDLLRGPLKMGLPAFSELRVAEADVSQLVPLLSADLVLLLSESEPVYAIVVEVQRSQEEDKTWSWPAYVTTVRARYRCPACLLVVAPDPAVARWASRTLGTGQPGFDFRPTVLGPDGIPQVPEPAEARANPELAVLSAVAHGNQRVEIAAAAILAISNLDDARATVYHDVILHGLNELARQALEQLMNTGHYEFQSDFGRKYFGLGKAEGEAKGKAEGKAEGEAKGKAESLLQVLAARGFAVSEAQRQAILGCREIGRLDRWIVRAVTAPSVGEVLAP